MAEPLACPEIECCQSALDGTLPTEQQERFEQHLSSCVACQTQMDAAGDP